MMATALLRHPVLLELWIQFPISQKRRSLMGRLEGQGLELRLHLDLTEPNISNISEALCVRVSQLTQVYILININTVHCTCSSIVVVFKRFQGMMLRSSFFG